MIIKNIDNHDLNIPFDFNNYFLPKNKLVSVEDNFAEFLKERFPLSFSFDIEAKTGVSIVQKTPAKRLIKNQTLVNPGATMDTVSGRENATFGAVDQLPDSGTVDADGAGWYGDGLELEGQNVV